MVIQNKFEGTVTFDYDREDYTGTINMHDNWVLINNNEYIPSEKIQSVKLESKTSSKM